MYSCVDVGTSFREEEVGNERTIIKRLMGVLVCLEKSRIMIEEGIRFVLIDFVHLPLDLYRILGYCRAESSIGKAREKRNFEAKWGNFYIRIIYGKNTFLE